MDVALLFALILFNGVLAMSEIALVMAKKSRLQRMADDGDKSALAAIRLGEEPTRFLSTIQIGITAIGLLNGIVGEAVLAGPLGRVLHGAGLSARTSSMLSTGIVVAGITYFSIVVGELVPKRLAQFSAESIARMMARPITWLSHLSRPFVFLLSLSTDALLGLLGKKNLKNAHLTEEDIHAVLADGSQAGVIEKNEHEIVRNVFRLDDRQIASLMTPRSEITCLDTEQSFDAMLEAIIKSDHSVFPVCKGGLDDILGVVSVKRLLERCANDENGDITQYLHPAVYVPESLTGMKLLKQFRESGVKMVFVTDEYGEVLGLVTQQNVLEALAGEFKEHDPEDTWAVRRGDGSWLLDGLIPIPELKDCVGLKGVPEEQKGRYNTLAGMMLWLLGDMPRTGDIAEWENWRFEVVDLDGIRIDKVLASRKTDEPEQAG